jgi:hypothetical protein
LTKWQVDKNIITKQHVAKQQVDKTASWQDSKLTKQKVDEMAVNKITVDKTATGLNDKLTE